MNDPLYVDENIIDITGQHWGFYSGGYEGDNAVSTGEFREEYTRHLPDRSHRAYEEVFATWVPGDNLGTDVRYYVNHGGGQFEAIVNQQLAPPDSVPDDPFAWQSLGVWDGVADVRIIAPPSQPYQRICADAVLLRGVDPIYDLLTDSNNDGFITAEDDPGEGRADPGESAGPGRIVAIGSSQLTEVRLDAAMVDAAVAEEYNWTAYLIASGGASHIAVWDDQHQTIDVTDEGGQEGAWYNRVASWQVTRGQPLDMTVWVEGLSAGTTTLELRLFCGPPAYPHYPPWTDKTKFTIVDPPTINIVPIDTATKELNPNSPCPDDPAMFLLTRTGSLLKDITVHLQYSASSTADPEDYSVNGAIGTESVVIPAGRSDVAVRLQALHDDMVADPDYDPETAIVDLAASPDGSYVVGQLASQTSYLYDTSDWAGATENPQRKAFPEYLHVHHTPPTFGAGYTVVIVMGGALDGAGSERTLWAGQTYEAFVNPPYVYNDLKNAYELVDVIQGFPLDSISRLVLGGHGTSTGHVGLQPTNNNTEIPEGYGNINDQTISADFLGPEGIVAIQQRLQPSAIVDIQSCGGSDGRSGAVRLANTLNRIVRYAWGRVSQWNQLKPDPNYIEGFGFTTAK